MLGPVNHSLLYNYVEMEAAVYIGRSMRRMQSISMPIARRWSMHFLEIVQHQVLCKKVQYRTQPAAGVGTGSNRTMEDAIQGIIHANLVVFHHLSTRW